MTAYATNGRYVPRGVNMGNEFLAEAPCGSAMSSGDTNVISPPDGLDITFVPDTVSAVDKTASPNLYYAVTLTSFDPTTGKLTITAGSAGIPAAATIVYRGAAF